MGPATRVEQLMASIDVGATAPLFELPDQDGKPFKLADALGKGPVVIFFYPKDETAGCTAEACLFRDLNPEFAAAGARIVGISSDSVQSHRSFADHHKLPYTLLADVDSRVRDSYGASKGLLGLTQGRVTFILDGQGVVRHKFDSVVRATRHVNEAIETVKRLAAA